MKVKIMMMTKRAMGKEEKDSGPRTSDRLQSEQNADAELESEKDVYGQDLKQGKHGKDDQDGNDGKSGQVGSDASDGKEGKDGHDGKDVEHEKDSEDGQGNEHEVAGKDSSDSKDQKDGAGRKDDIKTGLEKNMGEGTEDISDGDLKQDPRHDPVKSADDFINKARSGYMLKKERKAVEQSKSKLREDRSELHRFERNT